MCWQQLCENITRDELGRFTAARACCGLSLAREHVDKLDGWRGKFNPPFHPYSSTGLLLLSLYKPHDHDFPIDSHRPRSQRRTITLRRHSCSRLKGAPSLLLWSLSNLCNYAARSPRCFSSHKNLNVMVTSMQACSLPVGVFRGPFRSPWRRWSDEPPLRRQEPKLSARFSLHKTRIAYWEGKTQDVWGLICSFPAR